MAGKMIAGSYRAGISNLTSSQQNFDHFDSSAATNDPLENYGSKIYLKTGIRRVAEYGAPTVRSDDYEHIDRIENGAGGTHRINGQTYTIQNDTLDASGTDSEHCNQHRRQPRPLKPQQRRGERHLRPPLRRRLQQLHLGLAQQRRQLAEKQLLPAGNRTSRKSRQPIPCRHRRAQPLRRRPGRDPRRAPRHPPRTARQPRAPPAPRRNLRRHQRQPRPQRRPENQRQQSARQPTRHRHRPRPYLQHQSRQRRTARQTLAGLHTSGEKDLQASFNGSDSGFTLRTDKNPNTVRAGLTGEYQTAKGVIIRAGVSDNLRKGKNNLQDTLSVGVKF